MGRAEPRLNYGKRTNSFSSILVEYSKVHIYRAEYTESMIHQ